MAKRPCPCYITHIEIVNRFIKIWVQHDTESAEDIERDIKNVQPFLDNSISPSFDKIKSTDIFLAKFTDGEFYRCNVEEIYPTDRIKVKFMDFGNSSIVGLSDLKVLNPEERTRTKALNYPPQAKPYFLYGVSLIQGKMNERDLEWLKSITLNFEFLCIVHDGAVKMISVMISNNLDLSQLIIQKNFGDLISCEEQTKHLEAVSLNYPYSSGVKLPDMRRPPPSLNMMPIHVASPMSQIARHEARKPTIPSYQPPAEKILFPTTSPTIMARKTPQVVKEFVVGETYDAYVSHVEDGPLQFFLQMKNYTNTMLPLLNISLNNLSLNNCSSALTQGALVIGMQPQDKVLKRAMVLSAGSNSCRVCYIDFGVTEELPYSHIFELPPKLGTANIKATALNFALVGANEATESCKAEFKKLVLGRSVGARVASDGPIRRAELFLEQKPDGRWSRNVAEMLSALSRRLLYPRSAPPTVASAAVVVHFESPTQVFIQIGGCDAALEPAVASAWMTAMPLSSLPPIATPILTLYEDVPYRALVMGIDTDSATASVFYVDYGNTNKVGIDLMREIPRDLVTGWPAQAVECSLAGAEGADQDALEASLERLCSKGCTVTIKVRALLSGDRLAIDLSGPDGLDIVQAARPSTSPVEQIITAPTRVLKDGEVTKAFPVEVIRQLSREPKDSISGNMANLYNRPKNDKSGDGTYDNKNRYDNKSFDNDKFKENRYNDDKSKEKRLDDRNKERRTGDMDSRYSDDGKDKRPRDNRFTDDKAKQDHQNWRKDSRDFSSRENRFNRDGGKYGGKDSSRFGDKEQSGKYNDREYGSKYGDKQFEKYSEKEQGRYSNKEYGGKYGERDHGGKYGERDHGGRFNEREGKYNKDGGRYGDRDRKFGDRENYNWKENRHDKDYSKGYEHDDRTKTKYGDHEIRPQKKYGKDGEYSRPKMEAVMDSPSLVNEDDDDDWDATPADSAPTTPCAKQFQPWRLEPGSSHTVILSHYDSPDKFYVRALEREGELNIVRDQIDDDKLVTSRNVVRPALGASVLATFPEDGLLYRAVVTKYVDDKSLQVLYVDYGNSCSVSKNEVFYASETLAATPVLAALCQLHGVRSTSQSWSSAASDIFHSLENITLKVESVKCVDGQFVHQVQLSTESGKSVAAQLIDAGIAKSTTEKSTKVEVGTKTPKLKVATPLKRSTELTGGEEWIERAEILVGQFLRVMVVACVDDETALIRLEAAKLVALACLPNPNSLIGCLLIVQVNSIVNERLTVTAYSEDGLSIGDNSSRISPIIHAPVVRSTTKASVVHMITKPDGAILYFQRTCDRPAIDALLNSLCEHYDNLPAGSPPREGALVAAKSHDGNWYRATVLSCGKSVKVKYLDYGNTETVSLTHPLDKKFFGPELCFCAKFLVKSKKSDLNEIRDGEWTVALLRSDIVTWDCDLSGSDGTKLMDMLTQNGSGTYFNESPFLEMNSVIGSELLSGDEAAVCITHVESPGLLWSQLAKHVATVEAIQEALQTAECYDGNSYSVFASRYAADGLWYRAVDADPADPDLVRFIDYGNTDKVSEKRMLSHVMKKPRSGYAVPLHLCVRPVGDSWSREAFTLTEEFVDRNELKVKVLTVTYKTVVDLYAGEESLCSKLVAAGLAVHDDLIPKAITDYLNGKVPSSTVSISNSSDDKKESSSQCDNALSSMPDASVPGIPAASPLSDSCGVFISHVESPSSVFIQLESDAVKIANMEDELGGAESFGEAGPLVLGQSVAALFDEDSLWYRATVVDPATSKVHFTDYGNRAEASAVRELPPDLRAVPSLAREVSLGDGSWSDEACDAILEAAEHGSLLLTMTIVESRDVPVVTLTNPSGVSLKDLITKGSQSADITSSQPVLTASAEPLVSCKEVAIVFAECLDKFFVSLPNSNAQREVITNSLLNVSNMEIATPKVGDLVAAISNDDQLWYRAVVTLTDPLTVTFIDYGNEGGTDEVRRLPESLLSIPQLAYECCLKRPSTFESWPAEAEDTFYELTGDPDQLFGMTVIATGVPNVVSLTLDGVDILESLGFFTKDVIVDSFESVENLKISAEILAKTKPCFISHTNSLEDFYVQLEQDEDHLNKILDGLLDVVPSSSNEWTEGQLVAALYPLDGSWYRGKILSVGPPFNVSFIDFGNSAEVTDVAPLPESLLEIPPLALHCRLELTDAVKSLSRFVLSQLAEIVSSTLEPFRLTIINEIKDESQPSLVSLTFPDGTDIIDAIMNRPLGSENVVFPAEESESLNDEAFKEEVDEAPHNESATTELAETASRTIGAIPVKSAELETASETIGAIPVKSAEPAETSSETIRAIPVKSAELDETASETIRAIPVKSAELAETSSETIGAIPVKSAELAETSSETVGAIPGKSAELAETSSETIRAIPVKSAELAETSETIMAIPVRSAEPAETASETIRAIPGESAELAETSSDTIGAIPVKTAELDGLALETNCERTLQSVEGNNEPDANVGSAGSIKDAEVIGECCRVNTVNDKQAPEEVVQQSFDNPDPLERLTLSDNQTGSDTSNIDSPSNLNDVCSSHKSEDAIEIEGEQAFPGNNTSNGQASISSSDKTDQPKNDVLKSYQTVEINPDDKDIQEDSRENKVSDKTIPIASNINGLDTNLKSEEDPKIDSSLTSKDSDIVQEAHSAIKSESVLLEEISNTAAVDEYHDIPENPKSSESTSTKNLASNSNATQEAVTSEPKVTQIQSPDTEKEYIGGSSDNSDKHCEIKSENKAVLENVPMRTETASVDDSPTCCGSDVSETNVETASAESNGNVSTPDQSVSNGTPANASPSITVSKKIPVDEKLVSACVQGNLEF